MLAGISIPAGTPEGEAGLRLLLTRYSVSAKYLGPPGPSDEQLWIIALAALHLMGFAGKMVSGHRATDPAIAAAHCRSGETLVGWIAAGTPKGQITLRSARSSSAVGASVAATGSVTPRSKPVFSRISPTVYEGWIEASRRRETSEPDPLFLLAG